MLLDTSRTGSGNHLEQAQEIERSHGDEGRGERWPGEGRDLHSIDRVQMQRVRVSRKPASIRHVVASYSQFQGKQGSDVAVEAVHPGPALPYGRVVLQWYQNAPECGWCSFQSDIKPVRHLKSAVVQDV